MEYSNKTIKIWNKLVRNYKCGRNLQLEKFGEFKLEQFVRICNYIQEVNGKEEIIGNIRSQIMEELTRTTR